jgi:hypothetical protein
METIRFAIAPSGDWKEG